MVSRRAVPSHDSANASRNVLPIITVSFRFPSVPFGAAGHSGSIPARQSSYTTTSEPFGRKIGAALSQPPQIGAIRRHGPSGDLVTSYPRHVMNAPIRQHHQPKSGLHTHHSIQ